MIEHQFTPTILKVLRDFFGDDAQAVFEASPLLQYVNQKTRAASRGSKSRAALGQLYALYVIVEDYLSKGFHQKGDYSKYDGAKFGDLFKRQRQLPFGSKLQNHHLNHRLNEEFEKFFPTVGLRPILRKHETRRYWVNTKLLFLRNGGKKVNIAEPILRIIEAYAKARQNAFARFLHDCEEWQLLEKCDVAKVKAFVLSLIEPNVDARIFEIVSYAILKEWYAAHSVFFGLTRETVREESLLLYKTGRTNANDGGIDFVMRPVGRFFQVTETIDVNKYFLDIDKVQRYPITFVVKSVDTPDSIRHRIREQAAEKYPVEEIVDSYMNCIEEIINIPLLAQRYEEVIAGNRSEAVIAEIAMQSKVEYNYLEGAVSIYLTSTERSDCKAGNAADFPHGRGPQGDAIRILNFVRCVRSESAK